MTTPQFFWIVELLVPALFANMCLPLINSPDRFQTPKLWEFHLLLIPTHKNCELTKSEGLQGFKPHATSPDLMVTRDPEFPRLDLVHSTFKWDKTLPSRKLFLLFLLSLIT
jgi:hypothetical protein